MSRTIDQRVERLENEVDSIYDVLSDVRTGLNRQARSIRHLESDTLDVKATQAEHSQRFDRVETALAEVLRRLPEAG